MPLRYNIGKCTEGVLTRRSAPNLAVEVAVLDGFGNVGDVDVFGLSEVGDGAGDFEDAIVGAGAEVQIFHSLAEEVESRTI